MKVEEIIRRQAAVRENRLGMGTEREVYRFEGDYVIKVPRHVRNPQHPKDDRQSRMELYIWNNCREAWKYFLAPVVTHFYCRDLLVLVMPLLEGINEEEIRRIRRAYRREQNKPDMNMLVRRVAQDRGVDFEPYERDVPEFCEEYGLELREFFANPYNIGFNGEGMKYFDYGWTGLGVGR